MKNLNVIITAGYDKAKNVIALCELLRREGIKIKAIIVVSPYSIKRIKNYILQRGNKSILRAFQRLYLNENKNHSETFINSFLKINNIIHGSLKKWSRLCGTSYFKVKSLNDKKSIKIIRELKPDWVIYGGGGILKDEFINEVKGKILNAHSGPLPEIRGMNACEWSLLLGYSPAVTIHLINRGIDAGGIIKKIPLFINNNDTIETLRGRCVVEGIKGIIDVIKNPPVEMPHPESNSEKFRQCYILAPALYELLEKRLTNMQMQQ